MIHAFKTLHFAVPLFFLFATLIQVDELYRAVFYCAVMPATLLILCKSRHSVFTNTPISFWVALVLLLYLFTSTLWSDDIASEVTIRQLRWFLATSIFIFSIYILGRDIFEKERAFRHIVHSIVLCATLVALASYIMDARYPARLTGPGFLSHAIQGPSVLISLWAIGFIDKTSFNFHNALLTLAATLALIAYTLLTQSRGPILTLSAAIVLFGALHTYSRLSLKYLLALALLTAALVIFFLQQELAFFQLLLDRGSSYRLSIWRGALSEISRHPVFGAGIASDFSQSQAGLVHLQQAGFSPKHPHNIILSVLYFGGAVGLGLFSLLIGPVIWGLLRVPTSRASIACIIGILTALMLMTTDGYRLSSGPAPMWFIFWLPIVFAMAYINRHKGNLVRMPW